MNYDYEEFTAIEPYKQGAELMFAVFVLKKMLGVSLRDSLIIYSVLGSVLWLVSAYNLKTYKYNSRSEWQTAFTRVFVEKIVKYFVIYHLLINLK